MIPPSPGLCVMVALDPVDFRKGAAGLAALVQTALGEDAFSRTIYVFRARRADRLKLVFWDGTGLCLFAKTLDAGAFRWPRAQGGTMRLSAAQLAALIEGLDWTRVHAIDARTPRAMV
jgi:transposase